MRLRSMWTVAGCAVALILAGGTPATANRGTGLREVELNGAGQRVIYLWDINARGTVVGGIADDAGNARMAIWRRYDRPVVIDTPDAYAEKLTDRGDVLGFNWYWSRGRSYQPTHQAQSMITRDMNDHRQIVGEMGSSAFMYHNGVFTGIAAPGQAASQATAINNRGEVLVSASYADALPRPGQFLWRNGVLRPIEVAGASSVYAKDINDRGQVLLNTDRGAYIWHRGRLTRLTGVTDARDINNVGVVVGNSDAGPVLWRMGRATRLSVRGWAGWSATAMAVNDHGDVAGSLRISRPHSFTEFRAALWRHGRLLASPSASSEEASLGIVGIGERGQIAGFLPYGGAGERPMIWVPARR